MSDLIIKLVDASQKLFTFLTWPRIGMIFVLLLLAGASVAFWDNRPVIYTSLSVGKFTDALITSPLPAQTDLFVQSIVTRAPWIAAAEVVQIDFRNNTRRGVYFYSDEPEFQRSYKYYQANKVSESPLFIVGDSNNNDRIINIMEQEMVCIDIPADLIRKIPATEKFVKQMCSISVPPRYGKMVGWINIYLTEKIPREQMPEYKQIIRSISDAVYDQAVANKQ